MVLNVNMLEVLLATLIDCSDTQGLIDTVRTDKYLSFETKTEIVEMLIKETPDCELNVARL